jgi:uncharacterized membrane protein YtjA (UPF0391 family)
MGAPLGVDLGVDQDLGNASPKAGLPPLDWNSAGRRGVNGRDRKIAKIARRLTMLYWALMFLVIALLAGLFGFGGIASTATGMAQILFVIALILFVVSLFAGFLRRNS